MRRQATVTTGAAICCVIDLLLAPMFLLFAAFAGDAPDVSATKLRIISAVLAAAIGSVVCAVVAVVGGLLGAPRGLVQVVSVLPVLAAMGFLVLILVFSH
jgi:hypothetical protein